MTLKKRTSALCQAVHSTISGLWDVGGGNTADRSRQAIRRCRGRSQFRPTELLEGRILLSATPYVTGSDQVTEGSAYTLNLFADGVTFDHWSINWGDGTGGSPDITTASFSATSISHTFTATGSPVIVATAIASGGSTVATCPLGLDPTYGSSGSGEVSFTQSPSNVAVVPSNGDILVLGSELYCYSPNGTLNTSFGTAGASPLPPADPGDTHTYNICWCLSVNSSTGQIAVGGYTADGWSIGIYNSTGTLTSSVYQAQPPIDTSNGVVSLAYADTSVGNEIALLGNSGAHNVLWLYNVDDSTSVFETNVNPSSFNSQVILQPSDGSVWIDGYHAISSYLAHYNTSGTLLSQTTVTTADEASEILQSSGDVVIGGTAALTRVLSSGSVDTSYGSSGSIASPFSSAPVTWASSPFTSLFELSDGQSLATNGAEVARLNTNGSLDTTFGTAGYFQTGFSMSLNQIAQLSNGDYELAGYDGTHVDVEWVLSSNSVTVVPPPPGINSVQINGGNVQPSIIDSLTLPFNESTTLSTSALTLVNTGGGADTTVSFTLTAED